MKNKLLNIGMYIATIPLIIFSLLSILAKEIAIVMVLGFPFIILGTIILIIKGRLSKKEEAIYNENTN